MKILIVASGKGGVGKSSIATAIALTIQNRFQFGKVGIFDADLHGSSIPTLLNCNNILSSANDQETNPIEFLGKTRINYNVECISIEFLLPKPQSVVAWRGLMQTKMLGTMWKDTQWQNAPLDLLVVDLPPGTGDVQMTMANLVAATSPSSSSKGVVSICTPDALAERSAAKGVEMWKLVPGIPFLGSIYNKTHWKCRNCGFVEHAKMQEDEDSKMVLGNLPWISPFQLPSQGIATLPLREGDCKETEAMQELVKICKKIWDKLEEK